MTLRSEYVGRFAPSPSGPLHLGSLSTALCSYLHAHQHEGRWLLRIEDIDQPRCVAGADEAIVATLQAHGLHWDGELTYQTDFLAEYQQALDTLETATYPCDCTRAQIKTRTSSGVYDGHCRQKKMLAKPNALRFRHNEHIATFTDSLFGKVCVEDAHCLDDFIVKRKDGLFAYNLVVVVDDIRQGVNHIVRGADLIDTTPSHLALYRALKQPPPHYMHVPVLCTAPNTKLSKQNHAPAIDDTVANSNLHQVLTLLGFKLPRKDDLSSVSATLEWAKQHALIDNLTPKREIIVESL
ncbi:tRNA glutamyl-Q(34) synthetase GluQRS [Alteromonas facilis]|uniref:tRNA glutamyl-Q(34) synthetase GluQRS n=1 Tax=Alteromonas facilis TaxID=2048004 RepID=UPI000C2887FC|nr:tRNA glutamyl-Q(34) synthetase GluQRS [Alteromonas facilis]